MSFSYSCLRSLNVPLILVAKLLVYGYLYGCIKKWFQLCLPHQELAEGLTCDTCTPGSFFNSPLHQTGCLPCICMGITTVCDSTQDQISQVKSSTAVIDSIHSFYWGRNVPTKLKLSPKIESESGLLL